MPEELQEAVLRTVPGLENVKMARPAYGVEYDYVDPRELARTSCYRFVPALAHIIVLQQRLRRSVSRYSTNPNMRSSGFKFCTRAFSLRAK
jgi:hypothetical protein